jgi:ATP-dependent Lon protease
LQDIPGNVKNGLEIVPVKWIDQVLDIALEAKPVPLSDEEVAAAAVTSVVATPTADAVKH